MPTLLHPERIWVPPYLSAIGSGILQVSGNAWARYLGYVDQPETLNYLKVILTVLAAGTNQVGEHGLFSSPLAPNGAGQTLTKIVADGTLTNMKSGSPRFIVANTTPWAQVVPARTHMWGVTRYAMNGTPTQPTIEQYVSETPLGATLLLTSANALTTYTNDLVMTLPSMATVNHAAPGMRATVD